MILFPTVTNLWSRPPTWPGAACWPITRRACSRKSKPDDTPVTVADRQAEALIRGRIERRCPGHAILGEEFRTANSGHASHRWIIDPIDGTKSFLQGVPLFAVLIGLEIDGVVSAGCSLFPGPG